MKELFMKNILLALLISFGAVLLASCAASDAATEEQQNTHMQAAPRPMGTPVNNGSAIAAKMISPVTSY
jgi:hypothetical protein